MTVDTDRAKPIEQSPPVPDPAGTRSAQHAEAGNVAISFWHDGRRFDVPSQLDWPLETLDHLEASSVHTLLELVLGDQFVEWRPGKTIREALALREKCLKAVGSSPGEASASAGS